MYIQETSGYVGTACWSPDRAWGTGNKQWRNICRTCHNVLMGIVGMAAMKVSLSGIPVLRCPCSTKWRCKTDSNWYQNAYTSLSVRQKNCFINHPHNIHKWYVSSDHQIVLFLKASTCFHQILIFRWTFMNKNRLLNGVLWLQCVGSICN